MKLQKILIFFILSLFPFGELLRFDVGNNIGLKPLDVIVVLCAICFFFVRKKKQNNNKSLIMLFPALGLFSLILNLTWLSHNQFLVSFLYIIRWISYALLFFVVSQFDKNFKRKILTFLFIDGLVILLVGYVQYFFYNSLKNLFYLGWDEHMHRIFSTFFDPNFVGAFYVLYFLFVAGGIKHFLQKKQKNKVIILGFILFFTLIAIFLTFSRSAILMLLVGSIIFLTLIQKKKLALFVLGAILLFGVIASPKFHDENMNLFRMNSSEARLGNYSLALRIIHDRPIFGVGFDSYRYTKELYRLQHDWTNAPSHADAGVDNSFLFAFATTGIFGLAAYMWMWKRILARAFYLKKNKSHIMAKIVIASTGALFIDALFINSLFFAPLMLWMWTIFGLAEDY